LNGGFTLVELLVVIGIIALLISILMPALRRARDHANRISCMSNMHSLMQAVVMYTSENKLWLPPSNWGGNYFNGGGDTKGTAGWLYDNPTWGTWQMDPTNSREPSWAHLEGGGPSNLNGGQLYRYLKNREVFKCPLHTSRETVGMSERYTSYLWNGSACDFANRMYKISKFKVLDTLMWETGEVNAGSVAFNDGCSFPTEWLSARHGGLGMKNGKITGNGGASVACIDGHAEWFAFKDYERELLRDGGQAGDGRLYISPTLPRGGRP
jgi:prepilin-type N-terminal cleavage/methylation domain-containing protein